MTGIPSASHAPAMDDVRKLREDFPKAFEAAFARLQVAILDACRSERSWSAKVASGVWAGLEFATDDPVAADLLTNGALAEGADGIARHERLVAYLAAGFLPGREERPDGRHLPGVTERAMAGGLVTMVAMRLDQGREEELPALASEAIQFVLTPYLGVDEARRVAVADRG
jgi:hypothetical protein